MFYHQNNQIENLGYQTLSPILNQTQINQILKYFKAKKCYPIHNSVDAKKNQISLTSIHQAKEFSNYGSYDDEDIKNCPFLNELSHNEKIISIVEAYLGHRPTIQSSQVFWNFGKETLSKLTQRWHRDPSEGKVCALFIYLTDVNNDNDGPHLYISKSHKENLLSEILKKKFIFKFRAKKYLEHTYIKNGGNSFMQKKQKKFEELVKEYIKKFYGPAGTIILTEPFGLHKALHTDKADRLMFSVRYN